MQILLRLAPLPPGDHAVALNAFWPLWLAVRQLTLSNPIGPVREVLERCSAESAGERVDHQRSGLSGLDALHPRLLARLDVTQCRRNRAGRCLTELMTANA